VRVDRVPGLGPVDAGPRLAGVRSRRQGQRKALAPELGADHFNPIPDEPDSVLHAGEDHTLEPGERPLRSVGFSTPSMAGVMSSALVEKEKGVARSVTTSPTSYFSG
jgi:hypothetical protein